jgi:hypothetical protein
MKGMHEEIVTLWNKPSRGVSAQDLSRLAKRIDVYIQPTDKAKADGLARVPINVHSDNRAQALVNVINVLSSKLETDEVNAKLPAAVDVFLRETVDKVDLVLYVNQLLSIFEDQSCKLLRVLKLVKQATLFIACVYMQQALGKTQTFLKSDELRVKDCSDDDGWRIVIEIADESITVVHTRRDQCLGKPIAADYWDVSWELRILFTPDMSSLLSTELCVTGMNFGAKLPSAVAKELKRVYYESINGDFSYSADTRRRSVSDEPWCWSLFGLSSRK